MIITMDEEPERIQETNNLDDPQVCTQSGSSAGSAQYRGCALQDPTKNDPSSGDSGARTAYTVLVGFCTDARVEIVLSSACENSYEPTLRSRSDTLELVSTNTTCDGGYTSWYPP